MNREEYVKNLTNWFKENNYESSLCHVSHGGTMLLLGLRENTEDIDLTVDQSIWDDLLAKGFPIKIIPASETYPEVKIIEATSTIDVHLVEPDLDLKSILDYVDGIWYRNPETTLADELKLNRPKDKKDILALQNLLSKGK